MSRKKEAIKAKLKKSAAFLAEANVLYQNKLYNTLINRLYYSCFHARKALLLTKDLVSKTHSGVVALLNEHYVKQNSFSATHAAFFKSLMNQRVQSDYDDIIITDYDQVSELIQPSRNYVSYTITLVDKYFEENPGEIDKPSLFS